MVISIKNKFILLLLGTCFSFFSCTAFSLNLPDIGDPSDQLLSPEQDKELGQLFIQQIYKNANVITDPEVQDYISTLSNRLVSYSDENTRSYRFLVLKDPRINAFAGPGGVIGINSGVIIQSQSEGELAAVVAHEIAHVTQHHLARAFEDTNRYSLPFAVAMIGGILLGISNPDLGAAAVTTVAGANIQKRINFTRANEEEADRIGMQLLARSGFDPNGMPSFFERLHRSLKYQQNSIPEFLRTHPLTLSRISESKSRAATYPRKKYDNGEFYDLIRAKVYVENYDDASRAVKEYQAKLKAAEREELPTQALEYGLALALLRNGNFLEARRLIEDLLIEKPDNISYILASAAIEVAASNNEAALSLYQKAYKHYANYRPFILKYAKFLLDVGRSKEARRLLRDYRQQGNYMQDLQFYELLAQAETQSGYVVDGQIAQAEALYIKGDLEIAIDKLEQAEKQPKISYYQKERVGARLKEIADELGIKHEAKTSDN